MELQLCLSLPTPITGCSTTSSPITTGGGGVDELLYSLLDLNSTDISCTTTASSSYSSFDKSDESFSYHIKSNMKRKRSSSDDAFEVDSCDSRTLPLLNWNKQPDDDDHNQMRNCPNYTINLKECGRRRDVVGWPPIKSYRRNEIGYHHYRYRHRRACHNYPQIENDDDQDEIDGGAAGISNINSLYVKAQIEGILITRKIDLSLQRCYDDLITNLLTLFGRAGGGGGDSVEMYNLAYQDNEGDWLLAEDVPWMEFVRSVHRLKLLRKQK